MLDKVFFGLAEINDSFCISLCRDHGTCGRKSSRNDDDGTVIDDVPATDDGRGPATPPSQGKENVVADSKSDAPPSTPPRTQGGEDSGVDARTDESPKSVASFASNGAGPQLTANHAVPPLDEPSEIAKETNDESGACPEPAAENPPESSAAHDAPPQKEVPAADVGEKGGEEEEENWEYAHEEFKASSWRAYAGGTLRSKVLGSPTYSEFLTQVAAGASNGGVPALNRLARAVSRGVAAAGAKGEAVDPKSCLWSADLSDDDGEGDDASARKLDIRIYDVSAASDQQHYPDKAKPQQKKSEASAPADSAKYLEEYVVTVCLLDEGPNVENTFAEIGASIKAAVIRLELPIHFRDVGSAIGTKSRARRFHDVYELNEELNSGAYATVYLGSHRMTKEQYAIKCISRKKFSSKEDAAVLNEVLIQSLLSSHPNIVRLHDFFEEKDKFYLIMELMSGGDLFDRIGSKKTYNERDARDLCRNLLLSLQFCHAKHVVHCDLKPKNMMLVDESNDTFIKLADFGLSARTTSPKSLTRLAGSPFYVAPEVLLRQPYDQAADMWSVGVIAYLLLSGSVPFKGTTLKDIFLNVVACKYDLSGECWDAVSGEAKELVRGLLKTKPSERLTAATALECTWFKVKDKALARRDLSKSADSLRSINARMKFKSAVFAVQGLQRMAGDYKWQYDVDEIHKSMQEKNSSEGRNAGI